VVSEVGQRAECRGSGSLLSGGGKGQGGTAGAVGRSASCAALGVAEEEAGQPMKKALLVLLVLLSACASNPPVEDSDDESTGPTIYGQISLIVG
jgi:hypothetical protein